MLRFALFANPDGLDMEHDAVFRALTRMSETARRQARAESHVCDLVEDIARRIWIKETAVRAFLYLSDNDLDALQSVGSDFPLLMLLETSQSFLDDIHAYWHVGLRNHHDVQQIPFWLQSFTERWNAQNGGTLNMKAQRSFPTSISTISSALSSEENSWLWERCSMPGGVGLC
jgi:hypothetical protein